MKMEKHIPKGVSMNIACLLDRFEFKNWVKVSELNWRQLSMKLSGDYISILEDNYMYLNFKYLSYNKDAIHILSKNIEKIDWNNLSMNPNAIGILKENLYNINWNLLCYNKNGIEIFNEQNSISRN
jgi:hypothetical protein